MKTIHFASILVLTVATAFACNDDGDRVDGGHAGSAGKDNAAGSAGQSNVAGTGNQSAGAGGGDAGSTNDGGVPGVAGSNEGGAAGAAGSNEGGAAGGGAGETSEAGAAGNGFGGAGGEGGAGVQAPLEILGSWDNNFGGEDIITETEWSSFGSASSIVQYDNETNVVYTEAFGTFSKNVYTEIQNDSFYYCTIDYGKLTLADAVASTKVADATTPGVNGCGTFSWTKNTRQ